MVYTARLVGLHGHGICNSRNFTMVYTKGQQTHEPRRICNSRNFTMVYTMDEKTYAREASAIAEILLWFTPEWRLDAR